MSEKLNYANNRDNIVGWAFIAAVANLGDRKFSGIEADANGEYDISLTINGVPVSFSHIMRRLEENIDHEVKLVAEKQLAAMIQDRMGRTDSVLDEAERKLREIFELPPKEY